jgi:hypothetical protein
LVIRIFGYLLFVNNFSFLLSIIHLASAVGGRDSLFALEHGLGVAHRDETVLA